MKIIIKVDGLIAEYITSGHYHIFKLKDNGKIILLNDDEVRLRVSTKTV